MSTAEQRACMGAKIVDFEAERDKAGHIKVYHPPANDGGGEFEVAGINVTYHAEEAWKLRDMIVADQYDAAEKEAAAYILTYTDGVLSWCQDMDPGVEFYLRDTSFNRGPTGCAKILQMALDVTVDGVIGPKSKAALETEMELPYSLLASLRSAREQYEVEDVGQRDNLWAGLVNRWNGAEAFAEELMRDAPSKTVTSVPASGGGLIAALLALLTWIAGLFTGQRPAAPSAPKPAPTPAPSPAHADTPWMVGARADIGFHETGVNHGIEPFIEAAKTGEEGDPWCAIWINAKLEDAGIKGSRSPAARSFEKSPDFVKLPAPAFGCVVTNWRTSLAGGEGHVFFYTGENDKLGIRGVGANENDAVRESFHDRALVTGYWWPKALPLPKTGAILVKDSGEPIVTSEV
jgi:uncharacterized protein (TIGR02594 family)